MIFFFLPVFASSPPQNAQAGLITENKGQIRDQHYMPRPDVLYYGEVDGLSYHLTAGGIHYQMVQYPEGFQQKELLSKATNSKHDLVVETPEQPITIYRVDVNYLGANERAEVVSSGGSSSVSHFYNVPHGAEPALYVRSWQSVTRKDIYTGIDLRYYQGKHGGLESDFVVQPGADYSQIALSISGAELSINDRGELVMHTPFGDILEGPVFAHQNGKEVASHWVVNGEVIRFELTGQVDPTLPLIIDPPVRLYGTYFGGSKEDNFLEISSDKLGNMILVGQTVSTTMIATTGAHQLTFNGGEYDGIVTKYNSNGELEWATYLGGNGYDVVKGCSSDQNGNIGICGYTSSESGIASIGAFITSFGGDIFDGFLCSFNEFGLRNWGTYIGGSGFDILNGCTTSSSGDIVAVGESSSFTGIATAGTFQSAYSGDEIQTDACILAFDSTGKRIWGSYIGVEYTIETGNDCIIDNSGNIIFVGLAWNDFDDILATPGAFQEEVIGQRNGLIFKFDNAGQRIWSTYFGGYNSEIFYVDVDDEENIIISGETDWDEFVVSQMAHQMEYGGGSYDAFLAKFSTEGEFIWGTCYGGGDTDYGNSLKVNSNGDIYLVGLTASLDNIASTDGYDTQKNGFTDGFLCKFNADGILQWATYYGGENSDGINGCTLLGNDQIVIAGWSASSESIVTPDGYKTNYSGGTDAFFAIFQDETSGLIPAVPVEPLAVTPNPTSGMVYLTDLPEMCRLTVRDAQGVVVLERSVTANAFDLDLGHLPSGMYILRVEGTDATGIKVARVVVE
ncbi:MAG: T9SS type A sorting domain-containing protein [Saprospiraceae bacterium]